MSASDQPKWVVGEPWLTPTAQFPTCGISCPGWSNRINVHGENDAEALALATKIAAFLNADEEVRRGCE